MDNLTLSDILPELGDRNATDDFEKSAEWNTLLNLTYAVWRVADATVENEFLKNKIKHSAADMLARYPNALAHEEKINGLLESARGMRALLSLAQKVSNSREVNFMILKNEYKKVSAMLLQKIPPAQAPPAIPVFTPVMSVQKAKEESSPAPIVSDRQKKILQFFNNKKDQNIKMKDLMEFLPTVTGRTIRNDLKELCVKKLVFRSNGHGQASFYRSRK